MVLTAQQRPSFRGKAFLHASALLVMLLLAPSLASAQDASDAAFSYEITNANIQPGGVAEYDVTVDNPSLYTKVFIIGLAASDATSWLATPSSIEIAGGTEETFTLKIIPKSNVGLGAYQLRVGFSASNGEAHELVLPINVNLDAFMQDYAPNVALGVSVDEENDPREPVKVSVILRNRNQLDISKLVVRLNSDLFYEEYNTSLGPRKEMTKEFTFRLNPLQNPGEYDLNVQVIYPQTGKVVAESQNTFTLGSYSTITPKHYSTSSWFLTEERIVLENEGNVERTKEIYVYAPWTKRIFMSSEPDYELAKIEGKTNLYWNPSVKPTEQKEIVIVTNYRPLVIAIIIIILLIISYFIFRSPVIILKESSVVSQDDEGISEIKVRIYIKNRSRQKVHSLLITDALPRITEHVESTHVGSLKPTRIARTSKKGTLLYWEIDGLEPYEERIMTYRAKSKLKIVGDMTLPRARVKFESANGRERIVISDVPLFMK